MGGRWQFRKVAHTTQAMVPDTFFFSLSELGRIIEKNEGRSLRVVKDDLPIPYGESWRIRKASLGGAVGFVPSYPAEAVDVEVLSPVPYDLFAFFPLTVDP